MVREIRKKILYKYNREQGRESLEKRFPACLCAGSQMEVCGQGNVRAAWRVEEDGSSLLDFLKLG